MVPSLHSQSAEQHKTETETETETATERILIEVNCHKPLTWKLIIDVIHLESESFSSKDQLMAAFVPSLD